MGVKSTIIKESIILQSRYRTPEGEIGEYLWGKLREFPEDVNIERARRHRDIFNDSFKTREYRLIRKITTDSEEVID